jgi:small subunit ribosomal protein S3
MWYASSKDLPIPFEYDLKVRDSSRTSWHASVSKIRIERPAKSATHHHSPARPGMVIGKKGEDIEALRQKWSAMMGVPVQINIEEVRKPDLDAHPGCGERRAAAGAANHVPPRHEACGG